MVSSLQVLLKEYKSSVGNFVSKDLDERASRMLAISKAALHRREFNVEELEQLRSDIRNLWKEPALKAYLKSLPPFEPNVKKSHIVMFEHAEHFFNITNRMHHSYFNIARCFQKWFYSHTWRVFANQGTNKRCCLMYFKIHVNNSTNHFTTGGLWWYGMPTKEITGPIGSFIGYLLCQSCRIWFVCGYCTAKCQTTEPTRACLATVHSAKSTFPTILAGINQKGYFPTQDYSSARIVKIGISR